MTRLKNGLVTAVASALLALSPLSAGTAAATVQNCAEDSTGPIPGTSMDIASIAGNASSGGYKFKGIYAVIDASSGPAYFGPCKNSAHNWEGPEAAAWIAVQKGSSSSANGAQIIQLGVVDCARRTASGPDDVCAYHPNEMRFFWAYGGCGQVIARPYARNLGPADYGPHSFEIVYRYADASYHFAIDGLWTPYSLPSAYAEISCWAAQVGSDPDLYWVYAGERDDFGDGLGVSGSSDTDVTFSNTQTYYGDNVNLSLAWRAQSLTSNAVGCVLVQGGTYPATNPPTNDAHCTHSGQQMNMWTSP